MNSNLLAVPSVHEENCARLADFAELECMRRDDRNVSAVDILRMLDRRGDSSRDERTEQLVNEVYAELAVRSMHCGANQYGYPYRIRDNSTLLELIESTDLNAHSEYWVYLFLLLATRMNMRTQRIQDSEDATALFELLCEQVAVRFWGGPSNQVRSIVFGTGRETDDMEDHEEIDQGKFEAAVNLLCEQLREGDGFYAKSSDRVTARDGKLDIVVWREFADQRVGQLIGFGQCKTGTYWDRDLCKLVPEGFCRKWMRNQPPVSPMRLYFVADRVLVRWYEMCVDGGILLDRLRIVEYADQVPENLLKRIAKWVNAAARVEGLKLS